MMNIFNKINHACTIDIQNNDNNNILHPAYEREARRSSRTHHKIAMRKEITI